MVMGPSESSPPLRLPFSRASSDHPSAGPTAKTVRCAPSSRCLPSHAASASELMGFPRASSNRTTASVRPLCFSSHAKKAPSSRKPRLSHCITPVQRFRYSCTGPSKASCAPFLRPSICASVTCIAERIAQPPLSSFVPAPARFVPKPTEERTLCPIFGEIPPKLYEISYVKSQRGIKGFLTTHVFSVKKDRFSLLDENGIPRAYTSAHPCFSQARIPLGRVRCPPSF
jgi:hypothetical protein